MTKSLLLGPLHDGPSGGQPLSPRHYLLLLENGRELGKARSRRSRARAAQHSCSSAGSTNWSSCSSRQTSTDRARMSDHNSRFRRSPSRVAAGFAVSPGLFDPEKPGPADGSEVSVYSSAQSRRSLQGERRARIGPLLFFPQCSPQCSGDHSKNTSALVVMEPRLRMVVYRGMGVVHGAGE